MPGRGRHVIISHSETTITPESDRRTYRLATHQFPNLAPTPGYRHLASFHIDPLPRWVFRVGGSTLERTICLARGKNALVMRYVWKGRTPALLQVRPLMPLRPVEKLVNEHGGMMQVIAMRPGSVEIQPVPELPPVVFSHEGMFMGSPDWWRRFEYLADRSDGREFQEDIWTPGVFQMHLEPGKTTYLVAAVKALPSASPEQLVEEARSAILAHDPGEERPECVRALSVAAEQFCVSGQRSGILAGYPFHAMLVRDWVMAAAGLQLALGRHEQLEQGLGCLLASQRGGLLPELLPEPGKPRSKPLPDATLWLFELARQVETQLGPDSKLLRNRLFPALVRAFLRIQSGARRYVWLSPDGLLVNGREGVALTWMDAHLGAVLVSPRAGLAVEQQALWIQGAATVARLARRYGHERLAVRAEACSDAAREAFRARFWCDETDYPYDCISEARDNAEAWADATVRPNALIALSIAPELFQHWQAEAIVERVRSELLTPRGIRSLSPSDPRYIGQFAGKPEEREVAYHRGTAWTHLLGFYARAVLRLAPDDMDVHYDLRGLLEQAVDEGILLGQVAQLADADPPHRPRGCPAQATSVAELLRALVIDLDV
ncbi:MAG: amylo-alpha-1,6-glucosidase [Polyangiaceae bacterium]